MTAVERRTLAKERGGRPPGSVGPLGQSATTVFGTTGIALTNATFVLVPNLTQTFTVPAGGASVYVSTDGGAFCNTAATNGFSIVDVAFSIDNGDPVRSAQNGGFRRLFAMNNVNVTSVIENWSFEETLVLTPGTHSVRVLARLAGGNTAAVSSGNTDSVLQGQLTVMILKN